MMVRETEISLKSQQTDPDGVPMEQSDRGSSSDARVPDRRYIYVPQFAVAQHSTALVSVRFREMPLCVSTSPQEDFQTSGGAAMISCGLCVRSKTTVTIAMMSPAHQPHKYSSSSMIKMFVISGRPPWLLCPRYLV